MKTAAMIDPIALFIVNMIAVESLAVTYRIPSPSPRHQHPVKQGLPELVPLYRQEK